MPGDSAFHGTGWAFPPTFTTGGAEVEMVSDAEDIRQALVILLNTHAAERPFQASFGCDLRQFLYEEIDRGLVGSISSLITDAVLLHEPRIDLNGVDVDTAASAEGLVLIRVDYTLRGTNSRFNLVYPFYLNESAQSPA